MGLETSALHQLLLRAVGFTPLKPWARWTFLWWSDVLLGKNNRGGSGQCALTFFISCGWICYLVPIAKSRLQKSLKMPQTISASWNWPLMTNEGWRDADTQERDLQSGCQRQFKQTSVTNPAGIIGCTVVGEGWHLVGTRHMEFWLWAAFSSIPQAGQVAWSHKGWDGSSMSWLWDF